MIMDKGQYLLPPGYKVEQVSETRAVLVAPEYVRAPESGFWGGPRVVASFDPFQEGAEFDVGEIAELDSMIREVDRTDHSAMVRREGLLAELAGIFRSWRLRAEMQVGVL